MAKFYATEADYHEMMKNNYNQFGYDFVDRDTKGVKMNNYESINREIDKIQETFNYLLGENRVLREENKRLKDEHYKDEELAKLKAEIIKLEDKCMAGFSISEEEMTKITSWKVQHEQAHPMCRTAVGGRYTYSFTPTSIGVIGKIECLCGDSFTFRELE